MGLAAACAGKMGVALMLAAIVGQLEMPCSVLEEGFVDDICFEEALQGAVNRHFIGGMRASQIGDLLLG